MIMLPSEDEMSAQAIEAMLKKYHAGSKEEFDKMLVAGLIDCFCACRISKDGKVTFLTKQEYEELWRNSQKDETDRV